MAPSVGIEVRPIDLREPNQIERAIATFAQRPNIGIILTAGPTVVANVNLIIAAAAGYKLPAVYIQRPFVAAGGLISYGPNFVDQYRHAADYLDRILKGEKPADLPVQAPNKYELAVNLKNRRLGLPKSRPNCFVVRDADGQQPAYVYFESEPSRRSAAKLLTQDERWRIAANIAKLPSYCASAQN